MPLYFFHVRDQHYLHEDREGIDLPDLQAVLKEALVTERERSMESVGICGLEFEITDSRGWTVLKVPIQERRRNPDLPPAQPDWNIGIGAGQSAASGRASGLKWEHP